MNRKLALRKLTVRQLDSTDAMTAVGGGPPQQTPYTDDAACERTCTCICTMMTCETACLTCGGLGCISEWGCN